MNIFRCAFILVFIVTAVPVSEAIHHRGNNAFKDILKTLMLNHSLSLQNVTTIVERLGIHDCSNGTSHHKCVKPESLFGFFNISTKSSVGETDFAKMATLIVYSLLPMKHHSENMNKSKVDVHKELLERYKTNAFCEQILDQFLRDINQSIGRQQSSMKCFSSHEILHNLSISTEADITPENLQEISTIIVSKLLEKQCIEVENKTPLPCASFFVDDLFKRYAKNDIISKEKFEELLKNLKIGKSAKENKDQDSHDDHDHRRRRRRDVSKEGFSPSLPDNILSFIGREEQVEKRRHRREADHHDDHDTENKDEKCYSVDQIFTIYNVDKHTGVNVQKFKLLSSGLLHQIATNACAAEAHHDESKKKDVDNAKVWGYGILCFGVLTIVSIIGVLVIPLMEKGIYQKVISFLIALAVATSVGDALLHLLPHALGLHGSHEEHNHGDGHEEDKSNLWKSLVAVGGIYAFYIVESITHVFLKAPTCHSDHFEHDEGRKVESNGNQPVVLVNATNLNEHKIEDGKPKANGNISEKKSMGKRIASVAWMLIIGDTFCNLADGIAIGVAFNDSITGGISTAIAIFCHEVPHELGTFAVLLAAGMYVKEAVLANFISSFACLLGLICGILIGEIHDVSPWIFGITAGVFLYVGLADLMPELMRRTKFCQGSRGVIFLLQNLGLMTGIAIMLVLAYYEESIKV